MIKKLRTKFILVALGSTFVVLFGMVGVINIVNYHHVVTNADNVIAMLQAGNGSFGNDPTPPHLAAQKPDMSPETPFATRYFTVEINNDGEVVAMKLDQIAAIDANTAEAYATTLARQNQSSGFYHDFRYRAMTTEQGNRLYIFVDCTQELTNFYTFLGTSFAVSALGLLVVFLLVCLFSKWVFQPIAENYRRQKQFITNVSHDIKTPLTIINANTEIIEAEGGTNEWTQGIKDEVQRLTQLTQNLVYLTKIDEQEQVITKTELNLARVVSATVKSFEAVALSSGHALQTDIADHLSYCGNEAMLRQMVNLLIDNAIKYASPQQPITVSLQKAGNKICLTVQNPHDNVLPAGNLAILCDRFYRADQARNSASGGHGIGLSVVKAIVAAHKGKITVKDANKIFTFSIIF
ncbi:MAG: HAMP domain-containing histidine kinase [Prevotella sp.]|nr:HAMP domain-containing histidine kinase [Prevotella sp.]